PGAQPARALAAEEILVQTIENPKPAGTLEDVLDACERQATRLGRLVVIVDWAEMKTAGVTRDTHVTLTGATGTVKAYLDQALRAATPQVERLGWYRVENTVFVTTQDYISRNTGRISMLASPGAAPARRAAGESPAPAPAPAAAKSSTGVVFEETPLETVFDYVREVFDVSIHVNWKALEASEVTRTTPVTIQVKNLSGGKILDLTVEQLTTGPDKLRRVYWYIEDGVVMVSTGQALNDTPLTTKVYPTGSLMADAPNFIGPRIDISKLGSSQNGQGSGGNGGLFGGDTTKDGDGATTETDKEPSRAERRKMLQEQLVTMIKSTTTADMWEPEGKGKVTILRDRVIVSQTKLGWLLMGK
ncbi:MAG: hypothetical protein NTV86_18740, partial [Planctomycetota bacterium]|nr:hypothetical protein [Planctomycetota bacterium]